MWAWSGSYRSDWSYSEEYLAVMLKIDYIVNSIFDSMTWLLSDEGSSRVWLVDCGDVEIIIEKIGGKKHCRSAVNACTLRSYLWAS